MRMRKTAKVLLLAIAAVTAITGCAAGHGTVAGLFVMVGGPGAGVTAVRLPGRVVATNTAGQHFTAAVSSRGRFTINLPPGTYQLAGYSPRVHVNNREMRCLAARPVHVRSGQSRHSDVYCSVHGIDQNRQQH
jgi:hypothetical protein